MKAVALCCLFLLLVVGCGPKVPKVVTLKDGTKVELAKSIKASDARLADLKTQLAAEKKNNSVLRTQAIRTKMYWASGICLLGMIGCLIAFFVVPVGKKYFLMGAAGFGSGAALAIGVAAIAAYLVWVALAVATAIAGGVIYYLRASEKTRAKLVHTLDPYVKSIPDLADSLSKKMTDGEKFSIKKLKRRLKLT